MAAHLADEPGLRPCINVLEAVCILRELIVLDVFLSHAID